MSTPRELAQISLLAIRSRDLADRVAAGDLSFLDAVDMAYSGAMWAGLVESVGDDAVQSVLAAAFGTITRDEAHAVLCDAFAETEHARLAGRE